MLLDPNVLVVTAVHAVPSVEYAIIGNNTVFHLDRSLPSESAGEKDMLSDC